jgi:hypothetical protein
MKKANPITADDLKYMSALIDAVGEAERVKSCEIEFIYNGVISHYGAWSAPTGLVYGDKVYIFKDDYFDCRVYLALQNLHFMGLLDKVRAVYYRKGSITLFVNEIIEKLYGKDNCGDLSIPEIDDHDGVAVMGADNWAVFQIVVP